MHESTQAHPWNLPVAKHPSKLDLGDYLPYLVNRVGTIIADQFGAEALTPHGLSIAMWRVIAVLASAGQQRQIDLADLTSTDASTLSRLVTRLVRLGLVTRTRSASSNREVAVKLSPRGEALVGRLIPIAKAYEATAIAGLPPARARRAQALPAPRLPQHEGQRRSGWTTRKRAR